MKLTSAAVLGWLALTASTAAFAPRQPTMRTTASTTSLEASTPWQDWGKMTVATALVTAALWSTPVNPETQSAFFATPPAVAKEMASGSGSRVNKDPESLLRLGLPIKNKEVRKLQASLEGIKLDIGSKRKLAAADAVKKSKAFLVGKDADKVKAACRDPSICGAIIKDMVVKLDPLADALKESQEAFQGSEQERTALDKAYAAQQVVVDQLTALEEQLIPAGYKRPVPEEYSDLPQLHGRATVEMLIDKADKSAFDYNGKIVPQAKLVMVIDGYTAPVTGGNFIDLVQKGFYNKMEIQRSDGFVVQTGDPAGEADGYVAKGSKTVGNGKHGERLIPLEILVRGDSTPVYESTIEDEGRGGEATVLPFSAYGAMGWAREEYDPNSGSSQFFWLLFDSDLTPAGKNVLDGRYPCFGYVTEGADFLSSILEGDVIVSAKVVDGGENLVQPQS
jgi:cyclophilin family peptidyl-prolyl cis-trans isomerase